MKIAIGTVQFGLKYGISNEGGTVDIDTINKILNVSKQHKIDMLDTAQAYGNSESQIGCSSSKGFNIIERSMFALKSIPAESIVSYSGISFFDLFIICTVIL